MTVAAEVKVGVYARIRAALDSAGHEEVPETVASRVIAEIEDIWDLHPLMVEAVWHMQRGRDRSIERRVFAAAGIDLSLPVDQRALPTSSERLATLRALREERFPLGDRTTVSWGQATLQQHLERITILSRMRAGIDATIRQHETAIAILRKRRASCLDEIL